MSKIIDDIKSGLNGIRGAGDTVRGALMEAADQTFESNQQDPAVTERLQKHRATSERGRQDIERADSMIARHEWKKKDRATKHQAAAMTDTNQRTKGSDEVVPGIAAPGIAAPVVPPSQVAQETTEYGKYDNGSGRAISGSRDSPHRPLENHPSGQEKPGY